MAIPTSSADKNWPKGPNFLAVVLGCAVAIIIVLLAAIFIVRGRAQKIVPMKTNPTPSQTLVYTPPTHANA